MPNLRHLLRMFAPALFILPLIAAGVALAGTPSRAATPTKVTSPGPLRLAGITIKNFGVVDERIFRGAQPSKDNYPQLAALGVKTVVDLRDDAKAYARDSAEKAGLRYINIPIDDHATPTDAASLLFIKAVTDPANGAVFVHCAGGRHRTGSMVAVYRMAIEGWTIERAYQEMLAYDFYTSNGHKGFKTYVEDYYTRMSSDPTSVPVTYRAPSRATALKTPTSH